MLSGRRLSLAFVALLAVLIGVTYINLQKEQAKEEALRMAAGKAAAEKEVAFRKLSAAAHLEQAKKLLSMDASETSVSDALNHIAAIDSGSPLFKDAGKMQRAYEEAKRKDGAQKEKTNLAAEAIAKHLLRVNMAKKLENTMLDQGINVDVRAIGKDHTVLHIKWVLVSKVVAHQLSKQPDFFSNAKAIGFRRVEITDGFDETWWWTL